MGSHGEGANLQFQQLRGGKTDHLAKQIGMDGKGAGRDNVVEEPFWHNIKYEEVYSHPYAVCPKPRPRYPVLQQQAPRYFA